MVEMMGFTEDKAKKALKKCDNNVERAVDYLFNHPDEVDEDEGKCQQS